MHVYLQVDHLSAKDVTATMGLSRKSRPTK
jgi:hypothetical protein